MSKIGPKNDNASETSSISQAQIPGLSSLELIAMDTKVQ